MNEKISDTLGFSTIRRGDGTFEAANPNGEILVRDNLEALKLAVAAYWIDFD